MSHGVVDEVIDLARVLRLGNQPGSVDEDAHRRTVACSNQERLGMAYPPTFLYGLQ